MQAPIYFAEDRVSIEKSEWKSDHIMMDLEIAGDGMINQLKLGLTGAYQEKNIRTVLASLDVLCEDGTLCISEESIRHGAAMVVLSTKMQGRWQRLKERPVVIADSGHNVGGLSLAMQQLAALDRKQLRIVFGVSKDKDYVEMLQLLPKDAIYYWCAADLPRSLPSSDLQAAGQLLDLFGAGFSSVGEALQHALDAADPNDVIYVGGSSFVVGEVLHYSFS